MLKEFSVAFDFETGLNISLFAGKYSNGCKQPVEVVFIRMFT